MENLFEQFGKLYYQSISLRRLLEQTEEQLLEVLEKLDSGQISINETKTPQK